jgi:hypothetical protein
MRRSGAVRRKDKQVKEDREQNNRGLGLSEGKTISLFLALKGIYTTTN